MAKVFILERLNEKQRHISLDGARDYGDIVYVFEEDSDRSSIWAESFKKELIVSFEKKGFNPEKDYFCIVGYIVPMVIAISELIVEYGEVRTLLYSAVNQSYLPKKLGANYEAEEITRLGKEDKSIPSGDLPGAS